MKLPKNYFENLSNSKYREYLKILPDMKKDNTRIITTLIFTFVAMSFFGIFAINPTLSTIIDLQKQLKDNESVHQQLATKINNLSKLQEAYSQLEPDMPVIMDAIPDKAAAILLVGQIQSLAKKNNLNISSLRVSQVQLATNKPIATSKGTSFTFILEAQGNYQAMLQFVTGLTSINRIIVIDSVSINKSPENASLVLNVRGRQYFKSQ